MSDLLSDDLAPFQLAGVPEITLDNVARVRPGGGAVGIVGRQREVVHAPGRWRKPTDGVCPSFIDVSSHARSVGSRCTQLMPNGSEAQDRLPLVPRPPLCRCACERSGEWLQIGAQPRRPGARRRRTGVHPLEPFLAGQQIVELAAKRIFRPATACRRSGRQGVASALGLAKTSKRSAA